MLHEAMPNAGYQVNLPAPQLGESLGECVIRGLVQPANPRIAISIVEVLPNLTPDAGKFAKTHGSDISVLFLEILHAVETLVGDAGSRNVLSDDLIGPPISAKR
jgi:hypothetical protein